MTSILSQPRIGVVIVNYNSGHYLSQCFESLDTSREAFNIVVVDNASFDKSLDAISEIVSQHRITIINNDRNLGFSAAVNIGMKAISNEHVVLLNPDCTIFPSTLQKMQQVMVLDSNVAVVGAVVFNSDGTEQRGCRRNEPTLKHSMITAFGLGKKFVGVDLTEQNFPTSPTEVDAVSGAAMMLRKEYFETVGGMDENFFLHCEDLDICRRMRDLGYKVVICPGANVIHSQGASAGITAFQVERHKYDGMVLYNKKHAGSSQNKMKQMLITALIRAHFYFTALKQLINNIASNAINKRPRLNPPIIASQKEFTAQEISLNEKPIILVTGTNSDVGDSLIQQLSVRPYKCIAMHRGVKPNSDNFDSVTWLNFEFFRKRGGDEFGPIYAWINLAPVWTTRTLADSFDNFWPDRIIAMSSTSIEGKSDSDAAVDIDVVKNLTDGEQWLKAYAQENDIEAVTLRPTLIYGGPRNRSINFIIKLIRIIRCFPLIAGGGGKRQPVHIEDVAVACISILGKDSITNKTYNIAGGEILSYRHMVERIFQSLNIQPRFFDLPIGIARTATKILSCVPGLGFLHPNMAQRMQKDLVYSNTDATQDFSYNPRKFLP